MANVNVNAPAEQAPAMAPPTRTDDQTDPTSQQMGAYEQWFDLTKDTLRDALQITPVDNNNAFSSPPTPDVLIKFVNDLGYPKIIRTLSAVGLKDLEYLRYGSKGSSPALSISKMKASYYPDVGLEQIVPDQLWIEEECK
ncbi:hypothetical protein Tco_0831464, partial [Tanacetum coccineum]